MSEVVVIVVGGEDEGVAEVCMIEEYGDGLGCLVDVGELQDGCTCSDAGKEEAANGFVSWTRVTCPYLKRVLDGRR